MQFIAKIQGHNCTKWLIYAIFLEKTRKNVHLLCAMGSELWGLTPSNCTSAIGGKVLSNYKRVTFSRSARNLLDYPIIHKI